MNNGVLYVFIDESGNLDFSEKGTRHFVLAAVTTLEPIASSSALQSLKYRLLAENHGGNEFQHFHASEDKQSTRDAVISTLGELDRIVVNWLWAEKSKTHPSYRKRERFYALLG